VSYEEDVEYALKLRSLGYSDPLIEAILIIDEARKKDPKESLELLEEALKMLKGIDKEARLRRARALFFKARSEYSLGYHKKALKDVEEAIEEMPYENEELGRMYLLKARLLEEIMDHNGAIRAAERALMLLKDPYAKIEAYFRKALSYMYLRRGEEALRVLDEAKKEFSNVEDRVLLAEIYRIRGEFLMNLRRPYEALKNGIKAYKYAHKRASVEDRARNVTLLSLKLILRAAVELKLVKEAMRAFSLIPKYLPRDESKANQEMKDVLDTIGPMLDEMLSVDPKFLLKVLAKVDERIPEGKPKLYVRLYEGEALLKEGEARESLEIFKEVLEKAGKDKKLKARAYLGISKAMIQLGRPDLSAKFFEKAKRTLEKDR